MATAPIRLDEQVHRRDAELMRWQGLIGWVLFHPATGIVLHLYKTLRGAEAAVPSLSMRHGVPFRVLAVRAQGQAYEHVGGKATQLALNGEGRAIHVPMHGRRINRRGLRQFVPIQQMKVARRSTQSQTGGDAHG